MTVICDPGLRLVALPRHHGICADCGRLAPCPDELAERRLERLFDQPAPAQPINVAASLSSCGQPATLNQPKDQS